MAIDRKPVRYAHSDGHTDVWYSEDGTKLLTCGTDGDIRIWNGFDDDDPVQTCVGDWNLCIRQKGNNIFVATDNNDIQILTYPEAERNGVLLRCTAHINHIVVGKENTIAAASEDMEVKIIKLDDSETTHKETVAFSDLKGPPLSVALCPKGKFLAVSCGDGNLYIWEINTKTLVKTFAVVPKVNSFMNAKTLCRIDFDPKDGRMFAYPDKNNIIVLNTSDWSEKLKLTTTDVESLFSIVQYSPCGRYLAACSLTGDIVIWEVFSQNIIGTSRHSKPIALCALAWNPLGNGELAFCDIEGQLGIASNCTQLVDIVDQIIPKAVEEQKDVDFSGFHFEDDNFDEDDENTVSINKLKDEILGTASETELESLKAGTSRSSTPRPRTPAIPLQPPFMPSSTPDHLCPRYLCWNEVGIVQSYGNEDLGESKSIEVEFHDTSFHNSIMMPNFQEYTMGCLSTVVVCVANSSQISVLILSSGSNEWTQSVPDSEEIVCCACSDRLVCYATNAYTVRVSTVFGTQRGVFKAPGPIVSLTARGHALAVAYHKGSVRQMDMCLGVLLVDFSGLIPTSKQLDCPISPESTLQWLGLTDFGNPAIQDSMGILSVYVMNSHIWVPFCDTTKQVTNSSDGFFITAVFESNQCVRGVRCKGSIYPGFIPRPTQSEIKLEAAFAEMDTEKAQLEANLFTWSSLNVENVERKYKENAVKLFSLACQNNLDLRAFELMAMLNNPVLVTLAMKYASNINKQRLAEKLMSLASTLRQSSTETASTSQNVNSENSTPVNTPTQSKKLSLSSAYKLKQRMKRATQEKSSESVTEIAKSSSQDPRDTTVNNKTLNDTIAINSQESSFAEEEPPRNPFLKSLKKTNSNLSQSPTLNNSKKDKENDNIYSNKPSEKRKNPDLDSSREETEKPKDKQRKLDCFRFTKT